MDDAGFDPIIHGEHRLRVMAILSAADAVEFGTIQEELGLSKSALSKQLAQLTDVGYVQQERRTRGGRSRVWLALTKTGRSAYRAHIAALRAIIDQG